ncbi:hypothetical protein K1719_022334 [Acacia pycnantha]|nr:hypothetical protein K1719_022334 [Acacia pycnantha]
MAMPMPIDMYAIPELDFSDYTAATSSDEDCNYWNHWSPLVNWDALTCGPGHEGFHDLMETMMDDAAGVMSPQTDPSVEEEGCSNSATTTEVTTADDEVDDGLEDFNKGLRLVHLLMAAAEALTGANNSRDLVMVILVRLKELVSPTHGTNMERLAAYFTDALRVIVEGAHSTKHLNWIANSGGNDNRHQTDMLTAFQLLQDMSPHVKFAHFTANQAILESVAHDRRVHIVDYDIMEGTQWASLMQALASRKDGPHIRITAISRTGSARRSIATVQETGRRLTAFAASIGQPFSFHQCRLDSDETFRPSSLKLARGEAVVFNCMLHLPHQSYRAGESVESFLRGAAELKARVVTLVEEDGGPTGKEVGFVGRFMDRLHHYSAVYDSMEAGFPMQGRARALVERVFLGPRIAASLARIYRMGESESGSWGEWLGEEGFRGVDISFANHCQAKLLLGLFNDGYRLEEMDCKNKLVLSWKSRRLLSASVWTPFVN